MALPRAAKAQQHRRPALREEAAAESAEPCGSAALLTTQDLASTVRQGDVPMSKTHRGGI